MKKFLIIVLTGLAVALGTATTAQAGDCHSYRSYSYGGSCGPSYYRSYNCGPTYYRSYNCGPTYYRSYNCGPSYSRSYSYAPRYYSRSYRGGYCR
jgi:hypothetical protein